MKISVISINRNNATFLESCFDSLISQTNVNCEHIVVDGASNDGSLEIIEDYASSLDVFISESDDGIYDAMNKGLSYASGDVVGFLHSDDFFASHDVLSKVADIFSANPSVSAVYGDLQYVKRTAPQQVVRTWRSRPFLPRLLAMGWMPPHPTLYVRRECYERIGGFDARYRISADYFSVLQLFSQRNFKAVYLPEVMIKMRLGGASNRSLEAILRKSYEDWDALRRSGFGIFGASRALFFKNLSKVEQFL